MVLIFLNLAAIVLIFIYDMSKCSKKKKRRATIMSKYYGMSTAWLRDELDRLEDQLASLTEECPEDYCSRRNMENLINNVCNLLSRRECA